MNTGSLLRRLKVVMAMLASLMCVQGLSLSQARVPQCLSVAGHIDQFGTAYQSSSVTMFNVDQVRDVVDDEAAQKVRNVWDHAQWEFCEDGVLRITTYSEGEVNNVYSGQWAQDGTFTLSNSRASSNASSQLNLEGNYSVQDNQLKNGVVSLLSSGTLAAVVNDSSFGSAYVQYAEFGVRFSAWEGPAQPEAGSLTRRIAEQVFGQAYPEYRNVVTLTVDRCGEDVWHAFMAYEYDTGNLLGWMPSNGDYLFQNRGGKWMVTKGPC